MMFASTWRLELRAVDRRPSRARDRGDRADVIEVRVGQQDRLELLDPERVERLEQPLGLVAGIEDHGAVRALGSNDVASSPARDRP